MTETRVLFNGIYPILDAGRLAQLSIPPEEMARLLSQLSIGCVQLRCKRGGDDFASFVSLWLAVLRPLAPQVKIIINDDLDLALALDADGVHVGQEDGDARHCRQQLAANKILGVSTHNPTEIQQAMRDGADYVGFGPVFPTTSKEDAQAVQGISGLKQACVQSRLPVVAIGGITPDALPDIARSGAAAAAMISGVLDHDWRQRMSKCCTLWRTS